MTSKLQDWREAVAQRRRLALAAVPEPDRLNDKRARILAGRVRCCSRSVVALASQPNPSESPVVKYRSFFARGLRYPCGSRLFCPFCARVEVSRRLARVIPWLHEHPGRHAYGLTCTVQHSPEESLQTVLDRLSLVRKTVSDLWRDQRKGNRRGVPPAGAALSTEIVHHNPGDSWYDYHTGTWREYTPGWHPHFHAVLLSDHRIDYMDAIDEVNRVLPGQASCHWDEIVDKIDPHTGKETCQAQQLVEWCKYGLKYGDSDSPWDAEAWQEAVVTLHKRQLMQSFGNLRGYEAPQRPRVAPDTSTFGTAAQNSEEFLWYPPRPLDVPRVDCRTDRQKDAAASRAVVAAGPKPDNKPGPVPAPARLRPRAKKTDWESLREAVL